MFKNVASLVFALLIGCHCLVERPSPANTPIQSLPFNTKFYSPVFHRPGFSVECDEADSAPLSSGERAKTTGSHVRAMFVGGPPKPLLCLHSLKLIVSPDARLASFKGGRQIGTMSFGTRATFLSFPPRRDSRLSIGVAWLAAAPCAIQSRHVWLGLSAVPGCDSFAAFIAVPLAFSTVANVKEDAALVLQPVDDVALDDTSRINVGLKENPSERKRSLAVHAPGLLKQSVCVSATTEPMPVLTLSLRNISSVSNIQFASYAIAN